MGLSFFKQTSPVRIVVDSNFLMSISQVRLNLSVELETILDLHYELLLPTFVRKELEKLAQNQNKKLKTQKEIRRAGSLRAFERFEEFEQKIDRLEAEASLVNPVPPGHSGSIEDEFTRLENEDSVDTELQMLKKKQNRKKEDTPSV